MNWLKRLSGSTLITLLAIKLNLENRRDNYQSGNEN